MASKNFRVNGLEVGTGITISPNGNINSSGIITASSFSGNVSSSTYATNAGIATYASNAGIATYATNAGVSTYATNAGISTYATNAGIATYATNAGIATNAQGLTGTPNLNVGIITATSFSGNGANLTNIDVTRIVSGLSSVTVASSSTISANVNGSNIFNVTGTGVTMTSGKRLDVSSYSENVNFLGSVSGSTALDVGIYSVFVADISGATSVTFTLSGAVSGRLSSATLILRFSGNASRTVSLAFNPKYVGGAGPTYSATAVTDIISFFTADAGTTTYISVVGQGFA